MGVQPESSPSHLLQKRQILRVMKRLPHSDLGGKSCSSRKPKFSERENQNINMFSRITAASTTNYPPLSAHDDKQLEMSLFKLNLTEGFKLTAKNQPERKDPRLNTSPQSGGCSGCSGCRPTEGAQCEAAGSRSRRPHTENPHRGLRGCGLRVCQRKGL